MPLPALSRNYFEGAGSMKKQPLISVIMPVYNGARFVGKALDSVIQQTYARTELIVCDDGSTDETWSILKKYKKAYPKMIHIYRLKKNSGESVAANYAYQKAKGEFIARLDADDVAHRNRLTKQYEYMRQNPRVVVLGSQAKVINTSGKTIGHKKAPLIHESIYTSFAFINPMIHPSVMFRRSLLPQRPFLYRSNFETTDDYHTYFELLNYGQFANLPEELVSYRIHGSNKSLFNMKEKFWTDTKVRITAISHMGYQAPFLMFPAVFVQACIVTILPEGWLKEVFYYIRGMKKISINIKFTLPQLVYEKIKSYAATFLA